jgi:hypothetical protein
MLDGSPAQLEITEIMKQVPELPMVTVISLPGGPVQRMFLKKHLELLPWEKI